MPRAAQRTPTCSRELDHGIASRLAAPAWCAPAGPVSLPVWLLACLVLASACQGERGQPAAPAHAETALAAPTARPDSAARWHFHFAPTAALDRMDAEACFHGRVPERLEIQTAAVREALTVSARTPASTPPGAPSQRPGGAPGAGGDSIESKLDLTGLQPGDCVRYSVDLARVTAPDPNAFKRQLSAYRHGDDLVLSPDYYLLRPVGALDDVAITADFALPPGVQVLVPWPPATSPATTPATKHTGGPYRVPATTFLWRIHGALGRFDIHSVNVGGAELRVAVLGTDWQLERQALVNWMAQAAAAVADLYHGFPVPRAQALIVPTPGHHVGFGNAAQGGGNSVALLVGTRATAADLRGDWVAVHELVHLGMPMVDETARWLSEGVATYYEPVLRARAGLITPERAWELLHDGFQRGASRGGGRTLTDESRDMDETRAYWRVYWAGAAIALIADVTLRQHGAAPTLDAQMRAIRACCLDAPRRWSAEDLLARVAVTGAAPNLPDDLGDIASRYTGTSAFPDLTATYAALGLRFDADNRLVPPMKDAKDARDASARALRAAIMSPAAPPAAIEAGAAP